LDLKVAVELEAVVAQAHELVLVLVLQVLMLCVQEVEVWELRSS
jgi:hypothetical protein